ncbi:hypothetical protein [Mycobacterium sp. OTB74]|jgi:hypothetical protein|uniref:hypothetical protein n=1 Tax=Mycobacterium sp. OTB74 TaxID=1853452 RepID=UPI002474A3F6|nr:hypothetical protein [Mycobacterium sp. OTB74]MDH6246811.1 hypothetical protein [Mycobacterium sp. OTB74]
MLQVPESPSQFFSSFEMQLARGQFDVRELAFEIKGDGQKRPLEIAEGQTAFIVWPPGERDSNTGEVARYDTVDGLRVLVVPYHCLVFSSYFSVHQRPRERRDLRGLNP